MGKPGDEVHGEGIINGDASAGIDVILYWPGSIRVRTLQSNEVLFLTDIQMLCETGGDIWLVADGKVAGEYIVHGTVDAKGGIIVHFQQPRACAKGTGLKFWGAATNINSCIIEGYITQG